jgi:hypothetical protein
LEAPSTAIKTQLGAEGATLNAINGVATQLSSDPSNAFSILYEGTATVLNAMLNGADNVSTFAWALSFGQAPGM